MSLVINLLLSLTTSLKFLTLKTSFIIFLSVSFFAPLYEEISKFRLIFPMTNPVSLKLASIALF